jgi:hypothetical protein
MSEQGDNLGLKGADKYYQGYGFRARKLKGEGREKLVSCPLNLKRGLRLLKLEGKIN